MLFVMLDPLAGSSWSSPDTVNGFRHAPPNRVLMDFAAIQLSKCPGGHLIDIGCGAARNAVPLTLQGWQVLGTDYSAPMLAAAIERAKHEAPATPLQFVLAPMDRLPADDRSMDVVVAHGIWNLARSDAEFRRAIGEAARVAKSGAGLFVFTFSRNTLAPHATPVTGEGFIFSQFSGQPQCFLTRQQLVEELARVGFDLDPSVPFQEHHPAKAGALHSGRAPVIYEAAFRRRA